MQTLILSCNTGAGHNSCAQAVQEAYHSRGEICNITDSQVHVLGTVNNVPQLMQASDLFLTKPGGLSTSEAMAAELPMVLIDAVAGCETHNLNFFLRNGMAVTANTPKAIADTTIKTLNAPVLLSKMRAAMRSQTECTAADKIYEWIYSHAK